MVILYICTQSFSDFCIYYAETYKRSIMRLREIIITAVLALPCLYACEKADPTLKSEPGTPYTLTKAQIEMVKGVNVFAFNLLDAVSDDDRFQGKDFMVSPLSISFVLGALNNGATGETSREILKAAGYEGCSPADINEHCRYILQGSSGIDNLVKVKVANAVMVREGYELKEGFSKALETYYDAYVRSMKFDAKALEAINGWCNEQTEGLIPKILDQINPGACLYAMNSIYFKGAWAEKFEKGNTRQEAFTNIDGTSDKVWMMHMEDWFEYSSNEIWATVRLPYGNGSYSMYLLLPHEGKSIGEMIDALEFTAWENEKSRMNSCQVDLKMPRFETETDIDLIDIMKSLGMKRAFDAQEAEFGEMFTKTQGNVHLGILKQKSKITVNEEGTEAAAVTIGGMLDTAAPPVATGPVTFHADRPFVYLIQERSSNAIFFFGTKVRS